MGEKQINFNYLKHTLCVPSNVVVCLGSAKKKVRFALICKKKNMTHLVFVV